MVAAVKRYPTANCLRSKTVSCFGFVDARATAKAVWLDFQVWLRFSACVMTVFFRLPLLLSCLWRTPEAGSIPPAIFKAIRRSARRRTFSTRERAKMHHHAERRPDEYRPVLTALARIDDGVMVESLPLPEVPGARTVNDLRALGANGLGAPLWRN